MAEANKVVVGDDLPFRRLDRDSLVGSWGRARREPDPGDHLGCEGSETRDGLWGEKRIRRILEPWSQEAEGAIGPGDGVAMEVLGR